MNLGLDAEQLAKYVIRPTLEYIGWHSAVAEQLVLGTAITESRLRFLKQLGSGPALGIYQMEPATFRDLYSNYLIYRPEYQLINRLRDDRPTTKSEELSYNLFFCLLLPPWGSNHSVCIYIEHDWFAGPVGEIQPGPSLLLRTLEERVTLVHHEPRVR